MRPSWLCRSSPGYCWGPCVLGKIFPDYYAFVFPQPVVQALNGIAWWAVMIFVWIAGIELDLSKAWAQRRESAITAGLALVTPPSFGSIVAVGMSMQHGWVGPAAMTKALIMIVFANVLMDKGVITSESIFYVFYAFYV